VASRGRVLIRDGVEPFPEPLGDLSPDTWLAYHDWLAERSAPQGLRLRALKFAVGLMARPKGLCLVIDVPHVFRGRDNGVWPTPVLKMADLSMITARYFRLRWFTEESGFRAKYGGAGEISPAVIAAKLPVGDYQPPNGTGTFQSIFADMHVGTPSAWKMDGMHAYERDRLLLDYHKKVSYDAHLMALRGGTYGYAKHFWFGPARKLADSNLLI